MQRTCHARVQSPRCGAMQAYALIACDRSRLELPQSFAAGRTVLVAAATTAAVRSFDMTEPRARSNADAGLLRELDSAAGDGSFVQAWVRLKPKAATESLVQRVEQRVGHPADSLQLLPNLGALVVRGSSAFVRELIHQPEIESAHSTSQPLTLIRPVESREVRLPRVSRRPSSRRKRRPRG